MDVSRTNASRKVAAALLGITGMGDFELFRDVVLNREELRTISYDAQRDHAAHTVNNYLLGWYFFEKCTPVRRALQKEMKKRGVGAGGAPFPFNGDHSFFGCVWLYASLLHDVGYLFEEGLSHSDIAGTSDLSGVGVLAARYYFASWIWRDYRLDKQADRQVFFSDLGGGLAAPVFARDMSFNELAQQLLHVGDLEPLCRSVRDQISDPVPGPNRPLRDTFTAWVHHYERFHQAAMAGRVRSLKRAFFALIDDGHPSAAIRLLDHGVCSGLLVFLATTYYYRLKAAAAAARSRRGAVERFRNLPWSPAFWWTGIVWGTAAAAVHNVQVMKEAKSLDGAWPGRIRLSEDPLAYLGVLVDVLQEWDRYPVRPDRRDPVQGHEVDLGGRGTTIVVRFRGPHARKRVAKVRAELDRSLSGWKNLVSVEALR